MPTLKLRLRCESVKPLTQSEKEGRPTFFWPGSISALILWSSKSQRVLSLFIHSEKQLCGGERQRILAAPQLSAWNSSAGLAAFASVHSALTPPIRFLSVIDVCLALRKWFSALWLFPFDRSSLESLLTAANPTLEWIFEVRAPVISFMTVFSIMRHYSN